MSKGRRTMSKGTAPSKGGQVASGGSQLGGPAAGLGNAATAQLLGVGGASGVQLCDGTVAEEVRQLVNYTVLDLLVSEVEELRIVALLEGDACLDATVLDLDSDGTLSRLFRRVDGKATRRDLLQALGAGTSGSSLARATELADQLGEEWGTILRLASMGVDEAAAPFDPSAHAGLISSDPSDPFTGVGATGTNPTDLSIPWLDQGRLAAGHEATEQKYSNPLGDLRVYLSGLSEQERTDQATLLCSQEISTVNPEAYGDELPSRIQVIEAAAAAHNLHPELVAAIILAEQRDQTEREDAKDYVAADSVMEGNTSLGLWQVVVSTAQQHDLFSDLLSSEARGSLDHADTARLLASDEYNIFAVAKYLRIVADEGATKTAADLPSTASTYPNIDFAAYANNSSTWADDNISAIGSEYTSRAWDDNLSPGWGFFVLEAYQDVLRAGVF